MHGDAEHKDLIPRLEVTPHLDALSDAPTNQRTSAMPRAKPYINSKQSKNKS